MVKNPVMFTVEVVAVADDHPVHPRHRRARARRGLRDPDHPVAMVHGAVRHLRRGGRRGPRQGAGRHAAPHAQRDHRQIAAGRRRRPVRAGARPCAEGGTAGPGGSGRHRARRRRDRRRRGDGRRIGDHRRIRARHPRGGRRPICRHGGHQGAVRQDQGPHHRRAGLELPRPHDRAGRGRVAAKDAQRDCARRAAGGAIADLRAGRRYHPELRRLCRRRDLGDRPGGAVRHPDPDDHRRAVVGHRHCRHGSPGAFQRAGDVGPRGRGGRRCRYITPRQDRHDHAREPPGDRIPAGGRRHRGRGCADAAQLGARRRDAGGPFDRCAGQGQVQHPRPRDGAARTPASCPSPRRRA